MDRRKRKTVVIGMMERGGDVMLKVVENQTRGSLSRGPPSHRRMIARCVWYPSTPGSSGPFIQNIRTRGSNSPDFSQLENFGIERSFEP